jgi:hypothetical protein
MGWRRRRNSLLVVGYLRSENLAEEVPTIKDKYTDLKVGHYNGQHQPRETPARTARPRESLVQGCAEFDDAGARGFYGRRKIRRGGIIEEQNDAVEFALTGASGKR